MILFWLSIILQTVVLCQGKEKKGTLQYKLSNDALNQVREQLLSPPGGYFGMGSTTDRNMKGQIDGIDYTLTIDKFNSRAVEPKLLRLRIKDDELHVLVELSKSEVRGQITMERNGQRYLRGRFRIAFDDLEIDYRGRLDVSKVKMTYYGSVLDWDYSLCVVDQSGLKIDVPDSEEGGMTRYLSKSDTKSIYSRLICEQYPIKVQLGLVGLTDSISTLHFGMTNNTLQVVTEMTRVETHGDSLYLTMDIKSNYSNVDVANSTDEYIRFPDISDVERYPYEVAFNVHTFDKIFLHWKKKLGIGEGPVPLIRLVSQNESQEMIFDSDDLLIKTFAPKIEWIFPNSTVKMLLTDADFSFSIDDGEMYINMTLAINALVTLKCDTNRTFSAMNFTSTFVLPAQVGSDNNYLTLNIMGLGGKMDVWNSSIGHVVDGQLRDMIYGLPNFITSQQWEDINNAIEGLPLKEFTLPGLRPIIQEITLTKDYIVIGCDLNLSDRREVNKRLTRDKVRWYGKEIQSNETNIRATDYTPVNLQPMREQFCRMANAAKRNNINHKRIVFFVLIPFIVATYL